MATPMARGDWVVRREATTTGTRWPAQADALGLVTRVARDGTWAQVDWGARTQRVPVAALVSLASVPAGNGTR